MLGQRAAHAILACHSQMAPVIRRLQTIINYALKAERDLWGLLDGPWDGPDYANHRRSWSSQASSLLLSIGMSKWKKLP